MKKKGFTLIELLAVIVILAIIALIATPLVLKYIEKSRRESKVDSAYSFVRNLETEIANYSIKNNGKKYTTDKENIKELGLDITVKGENPEDGKVCISSVGQIEKGVFRYGKYYVSYDDKKGSIIDEDTYDNFSCSGNEKVDSIVFAKDSLVSFQKMGNYIGGILEEDITSLISEIKIPSEYYFKIKDKNTKAVIIEAYVLTCFEQIDEDGRAIVMMSERSKNNYKYMANIINGELTVGVDPEIHPDFIEGEYLVDFMAADREFIPYMFQVDSGGYSWLTGYNFVEGPAKVLVTDSEGTVYYETTLELDKWNNETCGVMYHGGVYDAFESGKIITVKVTQNIDGKDIITTIVGDSPNHNIGNSPMSGNTYSIGNPLMPIGA